MNSSPKSRKSRALRLRSDQFELPQAGEVFNLVTETTTDGERLQTEAPSALPIKPTPTNNNPGCRKSWVGTARSFMTNTRHDPLTQTKPAPPSSSNQVAECQASPTKLKKVSLSGIAKKKDDSTNKYPIYPDDDGKAGEIAARIAERQEQFDALESALETDKAELGRILIRPWYLRHFHRRTDVPSSVLVNWTSANPEIGQPDRSGTVRVTVKEQYYAFPSEDVFAPILGNRTSEFFRQSFELKIKGDKLPADRAGELVEKIQQLFSDYDCADALEAKEQILPVENFKAKRLAELDLEQSLALENLGEKGLTYVSVSTKGVRR